ncbi:unnamed protein product [Durusdinium trenchii]|uniref:J domain-containing protein n=1 Tax=Durusdinium trenchii TaxID=1381693 RepID=A0ABP0SEF8_9DINO
MQPLPVPRVVRLAPLGAKWVPEEPTSRSSASRAPQGVPSSSKWWSLPGLAAVALGLRRVAVRSSARGVRLRARNDPWLETVKTTELEEALHVLGFDDFPKMRNRQHLASWIQKLRIPYELVEGALKEVRRQRKAEARQKRRADARASSGDGRGERADGRGRKEAQRKKDGLFKFTEAELRTVLNVCGVQGTSTWLKEELVREVRSMKLRASDVSELLHQVSPRRPRSRSAPSRRRPRSRAEREFFGWEEREVMWEFLKEEYDDWDDSDSVDDYFEYTMDDEPWESVPWDFDDYFDESEEGQYRSQGPNKDYYYSPPPGADPWSRNGFTYSTSGASTWPKRPSVTPEETMTQAIREGWKAESLSQMQACMLLGLSGQPSRDELSKVRRQMALKWHPDKNPENAHASVAFQLVMAAAGKLQA